MEMDSNMSTDLLRTYLIEDLNIVRDLDGKKILTSDIEDIEKILPEITSVEIADDQLQYLYHKVKSYYPSLIIKSVFYKHYFMPTYRRKFPRATLQNYKSFFKLQSRSLLETIINFEKQLKEHKANLRRWPLLTEIPLNQWTQS